MKTLTKKLIVLSALLIIFVGVGCDKNEIEIADESVTVSSYPWLSVYKTKADYFNNITVEINDNSEVISYPDYNEKSSNVILGKDGKYKYMYKWLLSNGYVVVQGGKFKCAVTDISLTEFINFNEPYKTNWDSKMLQDRIIDTDPFVTFYSMDGIGKSIKEYTLGEIKEMIDNGTIEVYFEKLK